jgi:predicted outer membrane repeat protein
MTMDQFLRRMSGLAVSIACILFPSPVRAGGVWIVQGPSAGHHRSIQTAVNAAVDGDLLIVGSGTYAPFVIADKSLSIVAAEGATVQIQGTIEVRNLSAGRMVVLSGISSSGQRGSQPVGPGLLIADCVGHVRLQGCTHVGSPGRDPYGAQPGALLQNSLRVAMTGCTLLGGNGDDGDSEGQSGGDGIRAFGSVLALYDCTTTGGRGGDAYEAGGGPNRGGRGGNGCTIGLGLFASGSTCVGGRGGDAYDLVLMTGGDGGDGVNVYGGGGAHLIGNVTLGGQAGHGDYQDGHHGFGVAGSGAIVQHPGLPRRVVAPALTSDEAPWPVTMSGVPGDLFLLLSSSGAQYRFVPEQIGVRSIAPPFITGYPPGPTLPPSGTITVMAPPVSLQAPDVARLVLFQGLDVGPQGERILGSPLHKFFLDRRGTPDCNGNGILDYYDCVEGFSADIDHDLVPDSCEPDCNGNSLPDDYDIDIGTSHDQDGNGVPDECQQIATHYVDAAAPAGGDGSSARPFRTISEGVQASIDGDTVLVRDGLYTGSRNKNIELENRTILVGSQNGPASCIIDLQGSGRAFHARWSAPPAITRIRGFTIRNGDIELPDPPLAGAGGAICFERTGAVISNCAFVNNSAGRGGGAVACPGGVIEDCSFIGNRVDHDVGGALFVTGGDASDSLVIRGCLFEGNHGGAGGAVAQIGWPLPSFAHCVLRGNSSAYAGGAILVDGPARIDDCLLAGNTAGSTGGAIHSQDGSTHPLTISGTTFTGNHASLKGGAISVYGIQPVSLWNCVAWGDTDSAGHEFALLQSFGPGSSLTVSFSDVQGGQSGVLVENGSLFWGAGTLDLDPLFFDPDGIDNNASTLGDNDYRLGAGSPCVDAGDNSSVPPDLADIDGDGDVTEPVPLDLLRRPRFRDDSSISDTGQGTPPIVDMGALERQSAINP